MARHRAESNGETFGSATSLLDDVTGDYTIDPAHTEVGFRVRHAMIVPVRGYFTDVSGTAHLDAAHPERSSVKVAIKAASVDTRNKDRDTHLRSADFFDVEKFPDITFTSTSVQMTAGGRYAITGDLVIRKVSKEVTVEFELAGSSKDPFGATRVAFEGRTELVRKDWGLVWNAKLESGGVLVSEQAQMELNISLVSVPAEEQQESASR